MRKGNEIVVNGIKFKSFNQASKHFGVLSNTAKQRLDLGWSVEEAFGLVERKKKSGDKKIVVDGKEFKSITEACNFYSIDRSKVSKRLEAGWSIEEAFNLIKIDVTREKSKKVLVEGKVFDTLKDCCNSYNVKYETVLDRLSKGWSLEEALELKPKGGIWIRGKHFKSINEACRYYNVNSVTVKSRRKLGWSLEEALGLVERIDKSNRKCITVGGIGFSSIAEACRYYGVPIGRVNSRVNDYGWSLEEAYELVPRCVGGVIDIGVWNRNIEKVKIVKYLQGRYYKCSENEKVRYYSKDELFTKFKENR